MLFLGVEGNCTVTYARHALAQITNICFSDKDALNPELSPMVCLARSHDGFAMIFFAGWFSISQSTMVYNLHL